MSCAPSRRALSELGALAVEMASAWCWCVRRMKAEGAHSVVYKTPILTALCLSSFAAVLDARGGVVRAAFEEYLGGLAGDRRALGAARARILPHREGAVPYTVFLTYAAYTYKKTRDALKAALGGGSVTELLDRLAAVLTRTLSTVEVKEA
ncbi:hypothetical protein ODS41_00110 [Pyrobaculum sp. 3827-6]|uniref:hypothetical protein n=1 Tax=Pyrobaculum sp. 3827-6 TaxID=2983604 RepID=UPI0021D8F3E9|nr:hypothetical protein [Pyrobaculum sp. 3827-6]MCU7786336.1 hypothetical protein [Pyrobaculum sp. 3827-6]